MEELAEQQKIQKAKMESMRNLVKGISVGFNPMLNNVKDLVNTNAPKEEIFKQVDTMLNLIAQLERFSSTDKEK